MIVRDYLEVSDPADLCVCAGTSQYEGPYNVGSGPGMLINEIVEVIREVTGAAFKIVYKLGRPIGVPRSILNNSRVRNDFGWKCSTELSAGHRNTYNWLKQQA